MQPGEVHSLPGDSRERDLLGNRTNVTKQGALTYLSQYRDVLVRIQKECDQARQTHKLETTEGGTCQDTERI